MFSTRNLIVGTLATGGIAAAGYYGYRYYRDERTSLFGTEQDVHKNKDEMAVKKQANMSAIENELPQKHARQSNENTGRRVQGRPKKSRDRNQMNLLARRRKSETLREEPKIEETLAQEPIMKEQPAEDEKEEATLIPTPRIVHLQHVRNAEELESTFEALADYYVNQERSDEELKQAERELDWAWPIVLDYKSRVARQSSSSAMETEQGFSDTGPYTWDSSSVLSMVVTEDDGDKDDKVEKYSFLPSTEVEEEGVYENGTEESSSELSIRIAEDDGDKDDEVEKWRFMPPTEVEEDDVYENGTEESGSEPCIEVAILIDLDEP